MNQHLKSLIKNPIKFILRQIYKIVIVFPFGVFVDVYGFFNRTPSGMKSTEVCFLITSIIYAKVDKNVSYGAPRTIYTPEQRAEQTAETIRSIRNKVAGAKIILIEGGLKELLPNALEKNVDQYIYVGGSALVRVAADSKNKSLGEAMMLLSALPKLIWVSELYFKISGRYHLTDDFMLDSWDKDKIMFGKLEEDYYITRLYSFGYSTFRIWRNALLKGLALNLLDYAIEYTLARYIPKKFIQFMPKLGVAGLAASVPETRFMND
jgi:hypothetical protein